MAAIFLNTLSDTEKLGKMLAKALCSHSNPPLLLTGEPGLGKTTLTAAICRALPGAENAEVSSPSFTICNIYPCTPEVMHCDLYRCQSEIPEEALEFMEAGAGQIIIEWAQYLKPLPAEYLDISFQLSDNARQLEFGAFGKNANAVMADILPNWPK